jgi:serine/threonine protein kinase
MPKFASGSGSMTEWITCCRCDIVATPDPEAQKLSVELCSTCGKRITKGRSGSFTEFIFRYDLCSCGTPTRGKFGSGAFHDVREEDQAVLLEDEDEGIEADPALSISNETFPVDRYQPLRRIGLGAVGNVFLCHDVVLNKRVAVKTLHSLRGEQLVAFQNEARVLSKLEHPNIVRILDFGATDKGSPYMVLEYGKGRPLSLELAENGPLSVEHANQVFMQLVEALSYCHDHAVMHRDLKPENILLSTRKDGRTFVKLIDFGIAMVADQEKTSMEGKVITGTPAYMPPDQVRGYPYDARSEIYSFGCVLFEALTGRPPFLAETSLEVLNKHANEEPPGVADIASQKIPQMLQDAIAICLKKRPSDRFQNMSEVASALGYNSPEPPFDEAVEPVRRGNSTSAATAIAIICGVTVIAGGAAFYLHHEHQQKEQQAAADRAWEKKKASIDPTKSFPSYQKPEAKASAKLDYRVEPGFSKNQLVMSGKINKAALEDLLLKHRVTELTIAGVAMSDIDWSALSALQDCKTLYELDLTDTKFGDNDIPALAGVAQIKKLNLRGTLVTNEGIKRLARSKVLPQLEVLLMGNTRTTGAMFPYLSEMPRLRTIDTENIDGTTLADLKILIENKALKAFDFGSMPIGDEGMKILGQTTIEILEVEDCGITDKGLAYLSHQKRLRKLNIAHNPGITDKSVKVLAGLPNLQVLRTGMQTGVSKAGLERLMRSNPQLEIKELLGWSERPTHKDALNDAAIELQLDELK